MDKLISNRWLHLIGLLALFSIPFFLPLVNLDGKVYFHKALFELFISQYFLIVALLALIPLFFCLIVLIIILQMRNLFFESLILIILSGIYIFVLVSIYTLMPILSGMYVFGFNVVFANFILIYTFIQRRKRNKI